MKITVFNEKGGSGKSTLAVTIALAMEIKLIDLDDQRSSETYLNRRQPPQVITDAEGWVTDCPPGLSLDRDILNALSNADIVLIPVRAAFNDLVKLPKTLSYLKTHSKSKFGFVGSDIDLRSSDADLLRDAIKSYGVPLLGILSHRASYRRAGVKGQAAGEIDATAAAESTHLINAIRSI